MNGLSYLKIKVRKSHQLNDKFKADLQSAVRFEFIQREKDSYLHSSSDALKCCSQLQIAIHAGHNNKCQKFM